MSCLFSHHISFVQVVLLSLSISLCNLYGCRPKSEPEKPIEQTDTEPKIGTIVLRTDSDDWMVYVFKSGVLYGSGYFVDSPYHIPCKEEAQVLHTITYGPNTQRYVTCDGYTFGMPSATVSKAGTKTKYAVLGLWRRRNTISIEF